MALKTYILLDHLKPDAPIYQRINATQRTKLDKLPYWRPYLQVTFADKEGKNKTIRLKLNSNSVFQDVQIKDGIPANEPFTVAEREAAVFKYNVLMTNHEIVQTFLEENPSFEGFDGYCPDIKQPSYKLHDAGKTIESDNDDFLRRLAAANKVASLDLKGAQDLLIRIFGVSYIPPKGIKAAQNILVKYIDDAGDNGMAEIMKEDTNLDEETKILIGRLIAAKVLSFDAVEGQVAKKDKDGKWINLKAISSEYTLAERQRYFMEFITAADGKLLLQDLQNELDVLETKAAKPEKVIQKQNSK